MPGKARGIKIPSVQCPSFGSAAYPYPLTSEICLRVRKPLLSERWRRSDRMMLGWILILSPWVVLFSLIVHDATKDNSQGSAISIAAKNFKLFIFGAISAMKVAPAVEVLSSSSKPGGPSGIKEPPTPPAKKKWWRKELRASITIPELELAILEAVKKAAPSCEEFVGVIIRHETPKSRLDPNWAIRGVKFGNADRKMANEALATVVERMQREFLLSDD
jgi:hypothetical protein